MILCMCVCVFHCGSVSVSVSVRVSVCVVSRHGARYFHVNVSLRIECLCETHFAFLPLPIATHPTAEFLYPPLTYLLYDESREVETVDGVSTVPISPTMP